MTPVTQERRWRDVIVVFGVALVLAALAWLLGFVAALTVSAPSPPVPMGVDAPDNWNLFGEVWGLVDREFYGAEPTGMEITHGAIEGLVETLDDPYAAFVPGDAGGEPLSFGPAYVETLGAWVEPLPAGALVVSTPPGSPAARAALLPRETILAVDREALAGDRAEILARLEGTPGETAALVVRDATGAARSVDVERAKVAVSKVEQRGLEGGTAYIRLPRLAPDSISALDEALARLGAGSTNALVLDLRDNPGGDRESLMEAAARFLDGPVWIEVTQDGTRVTHATPAAKTSAAVPERIVVLVNEGTASEAEMLAGALRATRGAEIVGQPTFGKDTVQEARRLEDGSLLRLTVAHWRTPADEDPEGGLVPDREVAGDEAQLEAALRRLAAGSGG